MGVVTKELPHPYKLTHKNYKQKWMRPFLWWVSQREREERFFSKFLGLFFQNFLSFFFTFLTFSPYFSIFHSFSLYFSQKWGLFIGEEAKWEASRPRQGAASSGVTFYTQLASHSCHLIGPILFFPIFWSDFYAAVWRPF